MQKHEISELEDMWDSWWHSRAQWILRFCWLPRRCELSGMSIWLTYAYQGQLLINGPGGADTQYRWHHRDEHLLWLLKS